MARVHGERGMMSGVREIDVDGLRVAYLSRGDGPLVLLYHGFPDTAHSWWAVMETLADAGYRAVAPNLRGYAPTAAPVDGDHSLLAAGRDVLATISAFGARQAAVVGCDWGSLATYAAANLDPGRVWKAAPGGPHPRRLTMVDPEFLYRCRHFLVHQFGPLSRRHVVRDDLAYVDRLWRRWSPTWPLRSDDTDQAKTALRTDPSGPLAFYRDLLSSQLLPRHREQRHVLGRRTCVPTMMFAGTDDAALPRRVFQGNEEAHTGEFTLRWIPGAGHFPHRERPEVLARALLEFLGPASDAPR